MSTHQVPEPYRQGRPPQQYDQPQLAGDGIAVTTKYSRLAFTLVLFKPTEQTPGAGSYADGGLTV